MPLETRPWDMAENILTVEDVRLHLEAAFEDGDPGVIAETLGAIARSRGMTEIARQAGVSRETMYRAFRPEGNPTLDTLVRVMRALGLKLIARPA